jgi:hypothetical protein
MDTILTLLKVETMETMEWMETYLFDSRVPKPTELKVRLEVSIVSTLRGFLLQFRYQRRRTY